MKKTITVNLNGRVFTMDEDAYQLLDNYLRNLRIYFRKEKDSSEIIADFESRIEELFSEKMRLGYQVINIEQVEEVIARIGKPADFSEEGEVKDKEEEKQNANTTFQEERETKKKFFRNTDDKIIGGVCSGIAAYIGWDVLAVRILFIVILFATSLSFSFFYLIAWLVFPQAKTAEQKLKMQGKPITVENIGKTVAAEVEKPYEKQNKGFLGGLIEFIGGLLKVCFIGLGCLVGLPLIFVIGLVLVILFSVVFGIAGGIPWTLWGDTPFLEVSNPILATTTFCIVVGIPLVALIYTIIAYFAKLKPLNTGVKWVSLLIWVLALIMFLFSGFSFNKEHFYKNAHINWTINDADAIEGNGILAEKESFVALPVDYVTIEDNLIARVQIEQTSNDTTFIVMNGDENLIDKIRYELKDKTLHLDTDNDFHLRSENLIIRIQSPSLKGIKTESIANVSINRVFKGDRLEVVLEGAGKFQADSLQLQSLNVKLEGVGSITVAGKAAKAHLNMSGAGKIQASDLLADSVYAGVDGIGKIECNPVIYLKGRVDGVGKITYKTEPKQKSIGVVGMGKIGLE